MKNIEELKNKLKTLDLPENRISKLTKVNVFWLSRNLLIRPNNRTDLGLDCFEEIKNLIRTNKFEND